MFSCGMRRLSGPCRRGSEYHDLPRVPAHEGLSIETQNVVGWRETDLLRVADWFFPKGMNHHELLAGVPGVQRAMQVLARRVAGLGRLPTGGQAHDAASTKRRAADVLVVGAGPSGMAAAIELNRRGRRVEVIDDDLEWGGSLRALSAVDARPWAGLRASFGQAVTSARIAVRLRTTAAGIFGDDVLVADEASVEIVVARTLVLAPGAHDGVLAFEGNDVPGVMSSRAAGWLLTRGVAVGQKVVVAATRTTAGLSEKAYARAQPETLVLVRGKPLAVRGSARVGRAVMDVEP